MPGSEKRCDVDELDWIRWQLDRLAAARLLGPLAPEAEAEYEFLSLVEHDLMLDVSTCACSITPDG